MNQKVKFMMQAAMFIVRANIIIIDVYPFIPCINKSKHFREGSHLDFSRALCRNFLKTIGTLTCEAGNDLSNSEAEIIRFVIVFICVACFEKAGMGKFL